MSHYARVLQMPSRRQQLGRKGRENLKKGLRILGYVLGGAVFALAFWLTFSLLFSL